VTAAAETSGRTRAGELLRRVQGRHAVVAAALIVAAILRLPTLFQPLLEAHPFRQTQTALTAVLYHRDGIDLLHPQLPVVGPPWEVPFEFPLFQAGAALLMNLGIGMEPALRGLSLICFLATGTILWKLIEREHGGTAALLALLFFLFSPFSLLWSRAATIEYLATLLGVSFVALTLAWGRSERPATFVGALVVGALAMLVKITTGLIWVAPALLLGRGQFGWRLLLVGVPLIAGYAWTAWGDAIKSTGVITQYLTSWELTDWTIGTIAQRFDEGTWRAFDRWTVPLGIIGLVSLAFIRPRLERPGLRAWFAMTLIAGPLLFANLYAVHSYYWIAVSPALAGLLGAGFAAPIERWPRRSVAVAVVAVAVAFMGVTYVRSVDSWKVAYIPVWDPENVLPLAQQIRDATTPDELVFIVGRDWSPEIFLYADRRGIMLPDFMNSGSLDLTGYAKFTCPRWYERGLCSPMD
jgi:hypothetical protein